ncbi:MAG: hypothetical protein WC792_05285 [Candidatus Micrarchaeia archaeon]|jgi:hypothetical protein
MAKPAAPSKTGPIFTQLHEAGLVTKNRRKKALGAIRLIKRSGASPAEIGQIVGAFKREFSEASDAVAKKASAAAVGAKKTNVEISRQSTIARQDHLNALERKGHAALGWHQLLERRGGVNASMLDQGVESLFHVVVESRKGKLRGTFGHLGKIKRDSAVDAANHLLEKKYINKNRYGDVLEAFRRLREAHTGLQPLPLAHGAIAAFQSLRGGFEKQRGAEKIALQAQPEFDGRGNPHLSGLQWSFLQSKSGSLPFVNAEGVSKYHVPLAKALKGARGENLARIRWNVNVIADAIHAKAYSRSQGRLHTGMRGIMPPETRGEIPEGLRGEVKRIFHYDPGLHDTIITALERQAGGQKLSTHDRAAIETLAYYRENPLPPFGDNRVLRGQLGPQKATFHQIWLGLGGAEKGGKKKI